MKTRVSEERMHVQCSGAWLDISGWDRIRAGTRVAVHRAIYFEDALVRKCSCHGERQERMLELT